MKKIKLILIGGFLGAGKTTAMCALAKYYTGQGLRVGLITNDQANNLVDTHLVKAEGFHNEEIAGGCFCCRFNDLIDAAKRLQGKINPDIILAEPVGSCTDITATVIAPIKVYYQDEYSLVPYTTLLDPLRAQEIILSDPAKGFSVNITYIFWKQLEESDIIALNKIDTLSPEESEEIANKLKKKFPKSEVISISAKTQAGFEDWINKLDSENTAGRNIAEVNYDIYACGEAELAWLNFVATLSAEKSFDADKFLAQFLKSIKEHLENSKDEVAHLKLALSTQNGNSLINLVHRNQEPIFFKQEAGLTNQGRLIVNARVKADPEKLFQTVNNILKEISGKSGVSLNIEHPQYFRPSRPVPVHRITG
ncbi:MAG: GTP-binding protein [Candidatus Omnitrophica bacterium]|nr:GTP-binding protein [Candidatus Omnitrophota bacterium]